MKLTKKKLKSLDPCLAGYSWYVENGSSDLLETLLKVNETRSDWARWLYTRLMTVQQRRELAIYAAERVLPIFEAKYPTDNRPRLAIKAAKTVLKNDTKENQMAAAYAAAHAADAAYAADAAAYAADAAAHAADAAAHAAYAAAHAAYAAAARSAHAAHAAHAADAAAHAAQRKMQRLLIRKAVRILEAK